MTPTQPGFQTAVHIEHVKHAMGLALEALERGDDSRACLILNNSMKSLVDAQWAASLLQAKEYHRLMRGQE